MKTRTLVALVAFVAISMVLLFTTVPVVAGAERAAAAERAELGHGQFYPKLTIVVKVEQRADKLWAVYCKDRNDNIWCFFEDAMTWEPGDIANLLMWDVGRNEEDDEIVEAYWEGYILNE